MKLKKRRRYSHILLTGCVPVVDVSQLLLPEQDVCGLSVGSAVSCCMAGGFL